MKHLHQQTSLFIFFLNMKSRVIFNFTSIQGVTTEALFFFVCHGASAGTFFVCKNTVYNQIQKINMTIVLGTTLFCIFQTILVQCIYTIICRIMVQKENQKMLLKLKNQQSPHQKQFE